jgi:nicotinate-nucleotide adenylyltransferase
MRIGIFGGTFDPIHRGHLALAELALKKARLERIFFVTAVYPPHKSHSTSANFLDRHAMVALALSGRNEFVPCSLEYERLGQSYSIDTLRHFREIMPPKASLFFLIGMDAFLEIATWKENDHLLDLSHFLVFSRPGSSTDQLKERLPKEWLSRIEAENGLDDAPESGPHRVFCLTGLEEPISATQIREQLQMGQTIESLVPTTVADYIGKVNLYRRGSTDPSSIVGQA